MTHGWPGSVAEFAKVIGPLTDPAGHSGDPGDAFHVVCRSLPGYGFSDQPAEPGWGIERIADAWTSLMERLGYPRFAAEGIFRGELQRPSRRWAERRFSDIRYWSEPERGGHFAALEQPDIFVDEVRGCFRALLH
jgi:pimeloyl-ACP methyl ester carboxylesterase